MITSADFPRLKYNKPVIHTDTPVLDKILGIDSEAYDTGEPFMLCTSLGEVLTPGDIPRVFFTARYEGANFVCWNLKYDSGAILYFLPREVLHKLWREGKADFETTITDCEGIPRALRFRYTYIPHKLLRITYRKRRVSFWDISQFYKSSLDNAAKRYLNESKHDIATKKFSRKYVKRFYKAIARYCIQDAVLTQRLGVYLIKKLIDFGISPTNLYSQASVSWTYFCKEATPLVTVWRFWNEDRKILELATDAYEGGKFEVTARGRFTGIEYDITSAYPYEIGNLLNLSTAKTVYTAEYQPKAAYGFMRVLIDNTQGVYLPCGMKDKRGVRFYPAGMYYLTITKSEYDYMREIGVGVTILEAGWVFVKQRKYPYRKAIDHLFKIKAQYKGKDDMLTNTAKICMNGFYGKTCQCIEQHDGTVSAGPGWNPIHAAMITANTRIKVARLQNAMGEKCLAVHTDSVILTDPLPHGEISGGLGEFGYDCGGEGILIACGMYQLGGHCAFKGFNPPKSVSWESILSKYPNRKTIPQWFTHVESWVETMAKNHQGTTNYFSTHKKAIDLNCDTKRMWDRRVKARQLLEGLEQSSPKVVIDSRPPKGWEKLTEKI